MRSREEKRKSVPTGPGSRFTAPRVCPRPSNGRATELAAKKLAAVAGNLHVLWNLPWFSLPARTNARRLRFRRRLPPAACPKAARAPQTQSSSLTSIGLALAPPLVGTHSALMALYTATLTTEQRGAHGSEVHAMSEKSSSMVRPHRMRTSASWSTPRACSTGRCWVSLNPWARNHRLIIGSAALRMLIARAWP